MNAADTLARQNVIEKIIRRFSVRGLHAHEALTLAPDSLPADYRRSWTVRRYAERLVADLGLHQWQADGIASFVCIPDPRDGPEAPIKTIWKLQAASAADLKTQKPANPAERVKL